MSTVGLTLMEFRLKSSSLYRNSLVLEVNPWDQSGQWRGNCPSLDIETLHNWGQMLKLCNFRCGR
jgi:hypothetical protein